MTNRFLLLSDFLRISLVLFISVALTFPALAQDAEGEEAAAEPATASGESFPGLSAEQEVIDKGKALFNANCRSCHKVHENYTGPALANVWERVPSLDWIVGFVQNSQKVIASGDAYANKIYQEWNQVEMQAFPTLSREEVLATISYIQDETLKGPPSAQVATNGTGEAVAGDAIPAAYLNAILIGLVIILVLILFILLLIITVLKKYLQQQDGITEDDRAVIEPRFDIGGLLRSKAFVGLSIFVFTAIAMKVVINGLFSIGIQQGYAPKQPIAFSHALHAGEYEIDCNYCHTSVYKSKNANIPSVNICMNCHQSIKTESPEVQKIWAAYENDQPIEWVRIHNLPDLSYFNHSQHTTVAGLDCQTCHGPIEEMEVVRQHSLLTMGWCIDCHRQTNINAKDNAYYDKLVELHSSPGSSATLTVENIGGLECAKCHY